MKKLKYIEYTDYDEENPANRGWMKTRNIR